MDFFRFEDKENDFPFYNDNSKLSVFKGIILILSIFLGFFLYFTDIPYLSAFLFILPMLITLLYFLNWDYNVLFKKPSLKDIGLAILMVFAYTIYATAVSYMLESMGIMAFASNANEVINIGYEFVFLLFSMMGEELVKIILFLIFLTLLFKFSNNRKLSIIFSMLFTLILFGLFHAMSSSVIVAVVIQGLGSAFHLLLYVKTKNIVVSYISHFLTDFSITFLQVMNF